MTVFADSSAIVKLYVAERQHEEIRAIPEPLVISVLARVEVPSAIWRKSRLSELSAENAAVLAAAFAADVIGVELDEPRFQLVAATSEVIDASIEAVSRHQLRAYDAVQLASALATRRALDGLSGFAAFDTALRAAAAAEGLRLLPELVDRMI